jgi:heat shock protein 5
LSKDDKETILDALKEKTSWLEENPEAEAEDYEDQLSELQSTVGVSPSYLTFMSVLMK